MHISVTEAIKKIVEINGDKAKALAITVVEDGRSYTGIVGIEQKTDMRVSMTTLLLTAAMQRAIDRQLTIPKAILRGLAMAGVNLIEDGDTCKLQMERNPDSAETDKSFDDLLKTIFGGEEPK